MRQYFKNIFVALWTILVGLRLTFKHLFVRAVTIQYPDVKLKMPERERNRLYVNINDCIGCRQCEMACPVDCITIETVKALPNEDLGVTSTGNKKRLWVTRFDIDFAKCCYCGLCTYPCPTECIYMTGVYEFSEYTRSNLIYHFSNFTPEEAETKKRQVEQFELEQKAKKATKPAEQIASGNLGTQ